MQYTLNITVRLKKGMLDPEAEAIKKSLEHIGFKPEKVELAKNFQITIDAPTEQEAEEIAREMSQRLLANPVIHNYTITVVK